MRTILSVLAFAALAGTALAQGTPPEHVVVQGRTLENTEAYVSAISTASEAAGVLGRWNNRICPGVVGISATGAQTIIDQVARRANAVGLRTAPAGCSPNISIIVTRDGNAAAHDINEHRREMLVGPNGIESTSLGRTALDDFLATPRPIRWWHVTQTVMADGHVLSDNQTNSLHGSGAASAAAQTAFAAGQGGGGGGEGMTGADVTRSDGTRLRSTTRQDFNFVVVIVDANRVGGASLGALADYIAFVTLAEINPNVQATNYPSILNLFNADVAVRPTEMTAWDLAYLDGLYHMTRNARSVSAQRDEISRRIASEH
ncbi:MAG: hypothetical protein QM759_15840 [Terricaulis sp.]